MDKYREQRELQQTTTSRGIFHEKIGRNLYDKPVARGSRVPREVVEKNAVWRLEILLIPRFLSMQNAHRGKRTQARS